MLTHRLQALYSTTEIEEKLGTYMDIDETWTVCRSPEECSYVREDDTLIAHIRRGVISSDLVKLAQDCYTKLGKNVSSNRGHASGLPVRGKSHANFEKGREANSGIMGYIDNTNLRRPCRLTQFSKLHFDTFRCGLPFIQRINDCFKDAVPHAYERQKTEAEKTEFHIEGTAFSTVTVNYNFRTSVHKDSGDYRHGFGNLVVCQNGPSAQVGGFILFPRYKLAIAVESGDFVAMDVHEYHCNSPIRPGSERLSFICYLRERMSECGRVNETISRMQMKGQKNANDWIKDIFNAFNESVPVKHVTAISTAGHEWWERRGTRITIRYKNKRYVLIDHVAGKTINELGPAWDYAVSNSHHQSQEDDGSDQAR